MSQFEIKTQNKAGEISLNFDELNAQLDIELQKYNFEVTEENMKDAKEDKATLNKFATAIDTRRKDIKKEYCEPLVKFEEQMNILRDKAKKSYDLINNQVKTFDERSKALKKEEIKEYFNSKNFSLVTFEKLFDVKWLNKSCTDWPDKLDNKIEVINMELGLIDNFGVSEEEKEEIKGYYLGCLNISLARETFDRQKARREAIKKAQEEQSASVSQKPQKEPVQDVSSQPVQQVKKQRIVAEFIAERPFFDYLNEAIVKYRPQVKIISKEDVE